MEAEILRFPPSARIAQLERELEQARRERDSAVRRLRNVQDDLAELARYRRIRRALEDAALVAAIVAVGFAAGAAVVWALS